MPPTFFDPIRRFYKPQQLATAPISICHSPWRQNRSHCRYGLPPPAPTAKTMPWSRARRIPKFRRQPRRFFLPQPQVLMPRKQPLSETVLSMIPGPDPGPRFRCQESMYTAPRPRHRFSAAIARAVVPPNPSRKNTRHAASANARRLALWATENPCVRRSGGMPKH